jgi:hypothetical protein
MKYIAALFLILALVACQRSESDTLRDENRRLKTELEMVTKERDAFKTQLDGIRAILENSSADTTNPSSSSTPNPPPNNPPTPPATPTTPPEGIPSSPDNTSPSAAPPITGGALPPSSANPAPSSSEATEKLRIYAESVLSAAQNFKAQRQQEPPTDCSSGYTAGDFIVMRPETPVQECTVTVQGDGSYTVRVNDANGNSVTIP